MNIGYMKAGLAALTTPARGLGVLPGKADPGGHAG